MATHDGPARAERAAPDPAALPAPIPLATLIGEVALVGPDGRPRRVGGRQPQVVLAYLLIEDRTVSREELAELLWGEEIPTHWAGAVRGVLSKVRNALGGSGIGADALVVEGGTVRLALAPGATTDVALAADAIELAAGRLEAGRADDAIALARDAGRQLAGPFLLDGDGDWVRRQQERVADLVRRAASVEIEALLRSGRPEQAAERAAARVAEDVFDERAHHLRIESLLAAGRSSSAVQAYEQLAEVLRAELGIAPAATTTELVTAVPAASAAVVDLRDSDPRRGSTGRETAVPSGRRPAWMAPTGRFVGRSTELTRLEDRWAEVVRDGTPQVVVVAGHAGSGKTRLAAELSRRRAEAGARVLWGRCRPSSGIPYEPVVEALAEVVADDADLLERLGPDRDGLVTLFPELRRRLPDAIPADDSSVARAQMLRSVVAAVDARSDQPILWVVDDIQWASADTMTVLEVLLGALARPLLILATYRGTAPEVEAGLARVQRLVPTTSVALGGLDHDDVADLLADLPASGPRHDDLVLARTLHERTNGHPFLVTEIIAEARRSGHEVDAEQIPGAARDWINRRVGEQPPEIVGLLHLASVIGFEVDLGLLARCSTDPEAVVLDRCEDLVAAGLLVEADAAGSFAFPHRITREVVADSLGRSRRAVLHRTVGDALVAMPPASGRHRTIAHHYQHAGPDFVARAVAHRIEAGREALAQSAWDLATELFAAAVRSVRTVPDAPGAVVLLTHGLVGLGQAQHRAGDRPAARLALEEAVDLSRVHQLPVELADAALLLVGRAGRGAGEGMDDAQQAALLREALAGLDTITPDDDLADHRDALVLQLEGELALALLFTDAVAERQDLTRDAVTRVRASTPVVPANLARALLNTRITKLDPSQAAERLADLDEVLALPSSRLSPEQSIAAAAYRHEELLRLGRRTEATTMLGRAQVLADQHRHPYWQWVVRTWEGLGRLIDGDLDGAETIAFEAAGLQADASEESLACLGVNLVSIRLHQLRAGEIMDLIGDAAARYPHIPCYRAVLALCAAESGDATAADAAYRSFADASFAGVPDDPNRFLTLAVLAHTAAELGDEDGAAPLTELLTPYRSLHVVLNCYGGGGTYWGPASGALARLAALDGRRDDAAELFTEALAEAEHLGAPLHVERIRRHAGLPVG